jgi:hypothetical protein
MEGRLQIFAGWNFGQNLLSTRVGVTASTQTTCILDLEGGAARKA